MATPPVAATASGDAFYLKIPALADQAVGGLLAEQAERGHRHRRAGPGEPGPPGGPSLNAKMFTASKDVHSVGKETVGGVSTTHYQGTFTLADALAKRGTGEKAEAQKLFGQTGLDKLNFNLWVDGKQLPRKITLATPPGSKVQIKTAMNYVGFNVPVSITAPPESQVATAPSSRARAAAPTSPADAGRATRGVRTRPFGSDPGGRVPRDLEYAPRARTLLSAEDRRSSPAWVAEGPAQRVASAGDDESFRRVHVGMPRAPAPGLFLFLRAFLTGVHLEGGPWRGRTRRQRSPSSDQSSRARAVPC